MGLTYFKRYRMEIDLRGRTWQIPRLPHPYQLIEWDSGLLEVHADAKYRSFCFEIDANVFPCLGEREGCLRLMREIAGRAEFLPESTWLAVCGAAGEGSWETCGTIQGICDRTGVGAVQNLGVTPEHRGRQLGTALLYHALLGFQQRGLEAAYLEVTAQNSGAVRLYRRLGFRVVRTVYKAAEVAYA